MDLEKYASYGVKPTSRPYEKLSRKQKLWIEEYIRTGNGLGAARYAGYSKKELLHRGTVNKIILGHFCKARMEEMRSKEIADTEEVMKFLTKMMRGEEKDAFGLDATNQDKIKASELLGKAYQMYTDKIKQDTSMDINVTIEEAPVEEGSESNWE